MTFLDTITNSNNACNLLFRKLTSALHGLFLCFILMSSKSGVFGNMDRTTESSVLHTGHR